MGVPVTWLYVFSYLRSKFQKAPKWQRVFAHPFVLRIVAHIAAFYFQSTSVFAAITEDLPYLENRVIADPETKSGMRFEYRYTSDLEARSAIFRRKISVALKSKYKTIRLSGKNNINFGQNP